MARPTATVATVVSAFAVAVLTFPAFAQPGYCYRISVTAPGGIDRRGTTESPDDVALFLRLNPGATISRDPPSEVPLGPLYAVLVEPCGHAAKVGIVESLYPEAQGGPVAFVEPGGRIRTFQYGEQRPKPGWRKLDPIADVPQTLRRLGVPQIAAPSPTASAAPFSQSNSRPRFDPVAATFLIAACAGAFVAVRHRRRAASAGRPPP